MIDDESYKADPTFRLYERISYAFAAVAIPLAAVVMLAIGLAGSPAHAPSPEHKAPVSHDTPSP